jgi:predicted nucleic acid-binding protein
MILCDTNILIEFYKANPSVIQTLRRIGSANIAVSVITKAELFYGARNKQELGKIKQHLCTCLCYGLNDAISAHFIKMMGHYSLSHKVSIPDMLIAATAINHELMLYTLKYQRFQIHP